MIKQIAATIAVLAVAVGLLSLSVLAPFGETAYRPRNSGLLGGSHVSERKE